MPFTRTETTLQSNWTLATFIQAIKTAFSQLADTVLFDEYSDATKTYLIYQITYNQQTYGKCYLRIEITNSTLTIRHNISSGWNTSTHALVGSEGVWSIPMTFANTNSVYIQTFDNTATKEAKIVSLNQQSSGIIYQIFIAYPQAYRDPDIDNSNSKFLWITNNGHGGTNWFTIGDNLIRPYNGQPYFIQKPEYMVGANPSGNSPRIITGISLFPYHNLNQSVYLNNTIFGIFSQDIGLCFNSNNNAGTKWITNDGTYISVTKSPDQSFAIRCQ